MTRHVLHPPSPQHAHGGWHCQCSTVIKGNPAFFSVCTVFCGYNDDSRWVLSRTTHKCIWLYVTEVSDMWPHGCVWVTERGVNILVVQPHVMTFSRVCTPLVLYNPKVVTHYRLKCDANEDDSKISGSTVRNVQEHKSCTNINHLTHAIVRMSCCGHIIRVSGLFLLDNWLNDQIDFQNCC